MSRTVSTISAKLQQIARALEIEREVGKGGTHFRVWAPKRKQVEVVIVPESGDRKNGMRVALESVKGSSLAMAVMSEITLCIVFHAP